MTDRLQIINDALIATGNNDCAEFDGSVEWQHGEMAYRRSVGFLLNRHRWGFATYQWALAGQVDNPSHKFSLAYLLPNDVLLVESVIISGSSTTGYEVIDGKVCCDAASSVSVRGVRVPPMGQWPLHWVEVLTCRIEQSLYESLNEDQGGARAKAQQVEMYLAEIKTATDQEQPRRAVFRSRVAARRGGRMANYRGWQ